MACSVKHVHKVVFIICGMSLSALGARFTESLEMDDVKGSDGDWAIMKPTKNRRTFVHEVPNPWGLETLHILDKHDTKFAMTLGMKVAMYSDPDDKPGMANVALSGLLDGKCANGQPLSTYASSAGRGSMAACKVQETRSFCMLSLTAAEDRDKTRDIAKCFLKNFFRPDNQDGLEPGKKKILRFLQNAKREFASQEMLNSLAKATSPQSKVHVGAKEFLGEVTGDMVAEFLKQKMCISQMRLVIYGQLDLKEIMSEIQAPLWQAKLAKGVKVWPAAADAWPPESKGKFVIRHNTDAGSVHKVILQWIFEGRPDLTHWKTHPEYVLKKIFASDNDISLLEFLKANSLAHEMVCTGIQDPSHWRFEMSLKLTEEAKIDNVLHAVHYYISEIIKSEFAFKEFATSLAKKSQIDWELADDPAGSTLALNSVLSYLNFPAGMTLVAHKTILELDLGAVFGLISKMRPENMNILYDIPNADVFRAEVDKSGAEEETLMTVGTKYRVAPNPHMEDLTAWFEAYDDESKPDFLSGYSNLPKTPTALVAPDLLASDYSDQEIEPKALTFADAYYGEWPICTIKKNEAQLYVREGWVRSASVEGRLTLRLQVLHAKDQQRTPEELAYLDLYGWVLDEEYAANFNDMSLYPMTGFSWSKDAEGITLSVRTLRSLMGQIGDDIFTTVLRNFAHVTQARWNKELNNWILNPSQRDDEHPKFEAQDARDLIVESETYSQEEWKNAFKKLSWDNVESQVAGYFAKYPLRLTGVAMGAIDVSVAQGLFGKFETLLNTKVQATAKDTAFSSVKKLKQPVEVRQQTVLQSETIGENNVADVTLFTGVADTVERVLDQLLNQYLSEWVKEYKDLLDKHFDRDFVFTQALHNFGSYVRSWSSNLFSKITSVDELELLIEVFHLQVVPRKIMTVAVEDLGKRAGQWKQKVLVKQTAKNQYGHFKAHLVDFPEGEDCLGRLNLMHEVFKGLVKNPEGARDLMLERWLAVAVNPVRKRLVVKVAREVPGAEHRLSPERTDEMFHALYKDTELAAVPNEAFSANVDELKNVFSTGTAILSESIDSGIRKADLYEEEDYTITELCEPLQLPWSPDAASREGAGEEE